MKTKFEKIYVISLIYNKERQLFIKKQLNELGLEFEFIYGTDYFNIKTDRFDKTINYPDLTLTCVIDHLVNDKMYGCSMSHYQAVLQAYELGYNNVLILEDDICFIKDKNLINSYLNNIPKNADYITYSTRFMEPDEYRSFLKYQKKFYSDDPKFVKIPNKYLTVCGTMMYGLMNRNIMKLYLENQRAHLNSPDWVDGIFRNPNIKRYGALHAICLDQYHMLKYNTSKDIINKCNNCDFCYEQCNLVKDYNNFYNPDKYNVSNINTKLAEYVNKNQRRIDTFNWNDEKDE